MASLFEQFKNSIAPALQKELGIRNRYEVPAIEKVVVNVGFGRMVSGEDKKDQREKVYDQVTRLLAAITGQHPSARAAKKSISGFKMRQGDVIGMSVTLRGRRMFDFLDRLLHIAIPRVRDFRGIAASCVDPRGVCTIGVKEHAIFPELMTEEFGRTYGVGITVVPTTRKRANAVALYRELGFPFKKEAEQQKSKSRKRKK